MASAGAGAFRSGHPLTRIGENQNHFVGSLFWLNPGRMYEVRVTLTDPDGVSGETVMAINLETRPDVLVEPTLRQLYVSTSGSDTNSGTDPTKPLRTIQKAADISLPGDLILIQTGIYRESVAVSVSGTTSQPIVFRGDGPGVIVDGADEAIAAGVLWTDEGNGVYSFETGFATGHVVTEVGRLFMYVNPQELQTVAAGPPGGFYFDGTHLYVKFIDGSSPENNAISFTNDIGRGNIVRRNTIHGTFNGIGPCGSSAPSVGITNETDIYDNILYQHTDDAIEPEGYCANIRLWNNYIQDVHMAFAVAPAAPGPVYIIRNIAYRFGNTRTSLEDGYTASALKINSGYPTPIGPLYLYHNTFLTDVENTNAVALLNPGYSTFIRARNNIIAGTRYALYKVNPAILDWDWDNLFTTDTERFVSWQGTKYVTLDDFQAGTGQEFNGLSAEPELSDPDGGDFRPTRESPLVDRGVWLPGINDTYSGKGPDIGAHEFILPAPPSIPVLLLDGE